MAISKVVYGTKVLVDLTSDTVDAAHLAAGYTAHDAAGNIIVGTLGAKKNLLKGTSSSLYTSYKYDAMSYSTTKPLVVGKTYTISAYVKYIERSPLDGTMHGRPELEIFDGAGWSGFGALEGDVPGRQSCTFTYAPNHDHKDPNKIVIYNTPPQGTNVTRMVSFSSVMLVEGTVAAEWAPAEGE